MHLWLGLYINIRESKDNHVLNHPAQTNDAANIALAGRDNIDDISLHVPLYIPSISNHKLMLGYFVSKAATELSYMKRSSCMKDVTTENNCTFELGVGDGIHLPLYLIVGFLQRDQSNLQNQSNDTFHGQSVVNTQ